ncbi:MAG: hypothetical protein Hals2KO_24720 [Halioglobus sp.]
MPDDRGTSDPSPGACPDKPALHAVAEQLAQSYMPAGWQPVKSSVATRVTHHAALGLYFKEYFARSPAEALKARLRGSRAQRARVNADALRYYGIDAPETVHWGTLSNGNEYLFMRAAAGDTVHRLLTATQQDLAQRRRLLRDLGTFIGRLHATGFTHGDLRPGNILAAWCVERYQFTLLDNERNRLQSPPAGRRLLRNLMQLNMLSPAVLSATDRMRFFVGWRRQMRHLSAAEAKILGREAYRWAMRRLADRQQGK